MDKSQPDWPPEDQEETLDVYEDEPEPCPLDTLHAAGLDHLKNII